MHHHNHAGCGAASGKTSPNEMSRYLQIAGLTLVIVVVQFVGSVLSGSLALFADTVHAGLDCVGALISVFVAYRVRNHGDPRALRVRWMRISAALLLGALLWVAVEAVERFYHPQDVAGFGVMCVAAFGGLINYWQHSLVPHDHTETSRAQRLHVLGDLITSIAVIIGGALIWATHVRWIDPALSLVVVAFVGYMTIRLLCSPARESACGHAH